MLFWQCLPILDAYLLANQQLAAQAQSQSHDEQNTAYLAHHIADTHHHLCVMR